MAQKQNPDDKYFFNKDTRQYVIFSKRLGRNVVLSENKIQSIIDAYSDFNADSKTIEELSVIHEIPRAILSEILQALEITKCSLPITKETLDEKSDEEVIAALDEKRKFKIVQNLEKKVWRETIQDARKWKEFEHGFLQPFQEYLKKGVVIPKIPKGPILNKKTNSKYTFVASLTDVHFGNRAPQHKLLIGKEQSTAYVQSSVDKYAQDIATDVKTYGMNFDKCVLLSLGDILHTANEAGTTVKGTPLRFDITGELQFKVALDSIGQLILNLTKIFPKIEVQSFRGNHAGFLDNVLFMTLQKQFKNYKNVEFNINLTDYNLFRIRNSMILAGHGASAEYKAKPPRGHNLESYMQSLFMSNTELAYKTKNKVVFLGDLHHSKHLEFANFDLYLLPSIVRGDEYAESMNLNSRPCQQCFIFDDNGIKSVNNYYFD